MRPAVVIVTWRLFLARPVMLRLHLDVRPQLIQLDDGLLDLDFGIGLSFPASKLIEKLRLRL